MAGKSLRLLYLDLALPDPCYPSQPTPLPEEADIILESQLTLAGWRR